MYDFKRLDVNPKKRRKATRRGEGVVDTVR